MRRVATAAMNHHSRSSGWTCQNRTDLDRSREGYSLPCVPAPIQRKKVESNHQPDDCPPLAAEVAPTGHIFQAESKGIEPSALRLVRLSRPLADRSALPSMFTNGGLLASPTRDVVPGPGIAPGISVLALSQGFEPQPPGSEPGILPLDEESKWHAL